MKYDAVEAELREYFENADITLVDEIKLDIALLLRDSGLDLMQVDVHPTGARVVTAYHTIDNDTPPNPIVEMNIFDITVEA